MVHVGEACCEPLHLQTDQINNFFEEGVPERKAPFKFYLCMKENIITSKEGISNTKQYTQPRLQPNILQFIRINVFPEKLFR